MKKRVHAGIIVGMCAVIAISIISLVLQPDEPTDDLPAAIIIINGVMFALAFYIIFLFIKRWNLIFTLKGLKPSSTPKGQNSGPTFFNIPTPKFILKIFPIFLILTAILGVIVVISILLS